MYSQYNYHHGSAATSGSMSSVSTAVSTSQHTWDGQRWVQSSSSSPPSSSTLSQLVQSTRVTAAVDGNSNGIPLPPQLPPTPPGMKELDPKITPIDKLVAHFSTIYQYYQRQLAKNNSDPNKKQWFEYYCELSSLAAHHYNSIMVSGKYPGKNEQQSKLRNVKIPNQTTGNISGSDTNSNTLDQSKKSNRWGGKSQSTLSSDTSQPPKPPKSFKRYCHQSLNRCVNQTQKDAMQELIKLVVDRSYKDGSMFTKDWQNEDLLPISKENSTNGAGGIYVDTSKTTSLLSTSGYATHNPSKSGKLSYRDAVSSSFAPVIPSSSSSVSLSIPKSQSCFMKTSTSVVDAVPATKRSKKRKNGGNGPKSTGSISISSSNSLKKSKLYVSSLPENDSYYGDNRSGNDRISDDANREGSKLTGKIQSKGIHLFSSNSWKKPKSYDSLLPENDSYYGSNGSIAENNIVGGSKSNSKAHNASRNVTSEEEYNNSTPINDSYYGSNKGISTNNSSITETTNKFDDDYISLLPQKPSKKNKKTTLQLKKKNIFQSNDGFDVTKTKMTDRANRFKGAGGVEESKYSKGVDRYMGRSVITGTKKVLNETDYAKMTVKGTCQILEKGYLRLTSPPKAELVRPQPILEKHLFKLKKKWIKMMQSQGRNGFEKDVKKDYDWFCSQMKAIRQDLTVQRIFNSFSIQVYETHARIALEVGDLNEYNQSQTQLKELYGMVATNGDRHERQIGLQNENEFIAYRIIYYVFLTRNKKYDGGSLDLLQIMLGLSSVQRNDPCIAHALAVRVAVAENDYHSFFSLQDECPNMGSYLMDNMISHIRSIGLQRMVKSYFPSLPIDFCLKELGFYLDEKDLQDGKNWLKKCGCKFDADEKRIMTKESSLNEGFMNGADVKNSLI